MKPLSAISSNAAFSRTLRLASSRRSGLPAPVRTVSAPGRLRPSPRSLRDLLLDLRHRLGQPAAALDRLLGEVAIAEGSFGRGAGDFLLGDFPPRRAVSWASLSASACNSARARRFSSRRHLWSRIRVCRPLLMARARSGFQPAWHSRLPCRCARACPVSGIPRSPDYTRSPHRPAGRCPADRPPADHLGHVVIGGQQSPRPADQAFSLSVLQPGMVRDTLRRMLMADSAPVRRSHAP